VSACPTCRADFPAGARFCPACGTRLEAAGPEATERKVVTTLFADLVGFTALGERHDPEDIDAALRGFYGLARTIVERFGGTVEKFIGDAVVGLFGVPAAHEDDAERAVRAALELVAHLAELPTIGGERLQVRCAVNTGPALVRLSARPETGEGVLVGDAVNTCARLLTEAPAMGVVVGDTTRRLSSRNMAYERLPAVVAKGKARPVERWLAGGPISRRGIDLRHQYGAPLVGREVELGILKGMLARTAARAAPQLALVIGEAGVGKSRLAFELAHWIDQEPGMLVVWRQGRCLPYGEGSGFQPLADVVRGHTGITEQDDPDVVMAKLDHSTRDLIDREWMTERLGALLGLPARPAEQSENFAAWAGFLRVIAVEHPAVVFFDDLHWADQGLLDFVAYLLRDGDSTPLLLLGTARPELLEQHPEVSRYLGMPTGDDAPITRIDLTSLSQIDARRLVEKLSPDAPAELADVLIERSGGNPFYVEELVRLLHRERPGREGEWPHFDALPASLQALLTARLDALGADQKRVLSDAAVAGQSFPLGLVAALAGRAPDETRSLLAGLTAREFVRTVPEEAPSGQEQFAFRHALMRDAAYSQLPRAARAEKHAATARWLEQDSGGRPGAASDAIAHHYVTALDLLRDMRLSEAEELVEPSIRSLRVAADRELPLDVGIAERLYSKAVSLTGDDHPQRADLLLAWGETLHDTTQFSRALDAFSLAAAELRAQGDAPRAAFALRRAANVTRNMTGHDDVALEQEARLLDDNAPSPGQIRALVARALAAAWDDPELSISLADQALAMCRELGLPDSADALQYRGTSRAHLGDAGGLEDVRAALCQYAESGNEHAVAVCHYNLAEMVGIYEGPAAALESRRCGLATALARHDSWAAAICREGEIQDLCWLGEWDTAISCLRDVEESLVSQKLEYDLQRLRATAALLSMWRGDPEAARQPAEWAEEASRSTDDPAARMAALMSLVAVRATLGDQDEARSLLAEAAGLPRSNRMHSDYVLRLPLALRVAFGMGDPELAARLAADLAPGRAWDECTQRTLDALKLELAGADEAAASWTRTAEAWRALGVPYEEGLALLGSGRCLVACGRATYAAAPLAEAQRIFSTLGAVPDSLEAEAIGRRA
jgi:class 3 adenylate cyclase